VQSVVGTEADVVIRAVRGAGQNGVQLLSRTYVVVAPFPTVADAITLTNLIDLWRGNAAAAAAGTDAPQMLFVDLDTHAALRQLWGEPDKAAPVEIVDAGDLITRTWSMRPDALAVVAFDALDVRWKALHIDGVNVLERQANMAVYPLNLTIAATGDAAIIEAIANAIPTDSATNRDLDKMAVVAMTGVTAMVRGTAVLMEQKGITYPAQLIRDWLITADVAHISNEVSFWDKCPPPTFYDGTVMCSNPKYIELLKYVGTDVIELTGNHLWDRGVWNLTPTIQTYKDLGWGYFGGGLDIEDALTPLTMTVNGNKLAFVGCNWFGANWATPQLPGSAPCGAENPQALDLIVPMILSLHEQGYLVIATLQYAEYYHYLATPQQHADFDALRAAGAVVVNGSQGHHAQGFDVDARGFLHYGTGNLFFGDQAAVGTHQTFVDRHVFYNGNYLGVDLRTAFIQDFSQPKPMEPAERAALLDILFRASGY
jgi:poly-gamma-glutamate synthesis protein (capsule biosynthesis protein)